MKRIMWALAFIVYIAHLVLMVVNARSTKARLKECAELEEATRHR